MRSLGTGHSARVTGGPNSGRVARNGDDAQAGRVRLGPTATTSPWNATAGRYWRSAEGVPLGAPPVPGWSVTWQRTCGSGWIARLVASTARAGRSARRRG